MHITLSSCCAEESGQFSSKTCANSALCFAAPSPTSLSSVSYAGSSLCLGFSIGPSFEKTAWRSGDGKRALLSLLLAINS